MNARLDAAEQRFRADNFGAGPTGLPLEVLERVMDEGFLYRDSGMSVIEMSHRSRWYDEIQASAETRLRNILQVPEEFSVLFLQGGASLQFAMVPMNFLPKDGKAGYITTGSFAKKAYSEARKVGNAEIIASSEENSFKTLPTVPGSAISADLAYVHYTSNNTIYGTQWQVWPARRQVPVVADMSSDVLSRPIDVNQFDLIYAGAQKNLGVAGLTVALVRKDWAANKAVQGLPSMLSYQTHIEGDSRYNTPPVFAIYVLSELLRWVEDMGGLQAIAERNEKKASLLYHILDSSDGFYEGVADPAVGSKMNVTFRLKDRSLEPEFLTAAKSAGFVGINGHRSVGGCRVSLYNAVDLSQVQRLVDFMTDFRAKH